MECTLATLIACFSWSSLYVDGGLSYQDAGIYKQYLRYDYAYVEGEPYDITQTRRDTFQARNPYGLIGVGYQVELQSVTWTLELSHLSSIDTAGDRGVNSLMLKARWYPFR